MYKKSFDILKNNMIFIQPLLLWQIAAALAVYLCAGRTVTPIGAASVVICIVLLACAFLAGWLHINKLAVLSFSKEDNKEEITEKTIVNFKKFFEGAGADFIKTTAACILSAVIYTAVLYAVVQICTPLFGIPDFIVKLEQAAKTESRLQLAQYLADIPDADKLIFAKWIIVFNAACSVLNFLTLLYFTVMSFDGKNFVSAFFSAVKFAAVNIIETAKIIILMFFLYVFINLSAQTLFSLFPPAAPVVFSMLIVLLMLYFNYYVLLLFCFYYDKTKKQLNYD